MAKKKREKGVPLNVPFHHKGKFVVYDVDLSSEKVVRQGVGWVEVVKPSKKLLSHKDVEEFEWDEDEEDDDEDEDDEEDEEE